MKGDRTLSLSHTAEEKNNPKGLSPNVEKAGVFNNEETVPENFIRGQEIITAEKAFRGLIVFFI